MPLIEMIMMRLRLVGGLSIESFCWRIGVDTMALLGDTLDLLVDLALITVSDIHITLTRRGRLVSGAVIAELAATAVPAHSQRRDPARTTEGL